MARASSGVSLRRAPERVAEELLLDVDLVVLEGRVDRVAPAAEVDEVEELEVVVQLVGRDLEALDDLVRRDPGRGRVSAACEQECEQRLEDAEALRRDGPCRPLERFRLLSRRGCARRLRRLAPVGLDHLVDSRADEVDELGRRERARAAFLAEHPARELAELRVLRGEDAVLHTPAVDHALDPPGGVCVELDRRLADRVAELPVLLAPVLGRLEFLRHAEVALPPGREADVAADPRDAERAHRVAVVVVADHVPGAAVGEEGVGIHRALGLDVPADRVVRELDRALLRDRVLELRQAARHLGRVVGIADLDPHGGLRRLLVEAGPAEGEVLEGEAQRLRIGELAFEHVERGLQRRELVLLEL